MCPFRPRCTGRGWVSLSAFLASHARIIIYARANITKSTTQSLYQLYLLYIYQMVRSSHIVKQSKPNGRGWDYCPRHRCWAWEHCGCPWRHLCLWRHPKWETPRCGPVTHWWAELPAPSCDKTLGTVPGWRAGPYMTDCEGFNSVNIYIDIYIIHMIMNQIHLDPY